MVKVLLMGFVFFPNILSGATGDWIPLCEKYQRSDLVFEMAFEVRGEYPQSYRSKKWPPPAQSLKRIASTGKVVRVLKGTLESEMPWEEAFGYPFYHHASVTYWDAFYRRRSFRMVYFLKESGSAYQGIGGGESTLGCAGSSHFSWCASYNDFLNQLVSCGL